MLVEDESDGVREAGEIGEGRSAEIERRGGRERETHAAAAEVASSATEEAPLLTDEAADPALEVAEAAAPGVVRGVLSPPAEDEAPAAAEVAPEAPDEAATTEASEPSTATRSQEEDPARTVTWSA